MRHTTFGRKTSTYFFLEADNGANSGGSNSNSDEKPQDANHHSSGSSDVQKLADAILASQRVGGEPTKAIEVLAGQVLAKDRRIAELEGHTLSRADRERFEAFKTLNLTPEQITQAIQERDTLATEKQQRIRQDAMKAAVEVAGLDFVDFSTRKGVDDLEYSTRDEQRDGATVKVAYVKYSTDDGKEVEKPLTDYVTEKLPTVQKAGWQSQQQSNGVRMVGMPPAGAKPSDPDAQYWEGIQKEKEARRANVGQVSDWRQAAGIARD